MRTCRRWLARSPFGGWFKAFLSAALAQFLVNGSDLFSLTSGAVLKGLLASGVAGTLPVVINWLNRSDPRYGTRRDQPANASSPRELASPA
jgi:hypothetical protein